MYVTTYQANSLPTSIFIAATKTGNTKKSLFLTPLAPKAAGLTTRRLDTDTIMLFYGLRQILMLVIWDIRHWKRRTVGRSLDIQKNYGNNQIMQKVTGTRGDLTGGTIEMLGNPMRKGNSGGAWFITSDQDGGNKAMGNQSFNKKGNNTDAWGPVFNDKTFGLLKGVRDQ